MARSAISLIFTLVMTVFVLAPLMFAFGALLTEAHALLLEIAVADKEGIAAPHWLENVPLAGPWLTASCGCTGPTRLLFSAGRGHSDSS